MPGFTQGRALDKLGCKAQDTAELSFDDVRVPVANRLGEEGAAFGYLGHNLPQERMTVAVGSVAQARSGARRDHRLRQGTQGLRRSRSPRSRTPSSSSPRWRPRSRPRRRLLDRAVLELSTGELSGADAAKVKLFCTEMQARVRRPLPAAVRRLRLHDRVPDRPAVRRRARARIYAGTSEVMKIDHRQVARFVTTSENVVPRDGNL